MTLYSICRFSNISLKRDERVLVIWSDNLDNIIPICRDFEDKLIKLVWRARAPLPSSASAITAG